MYRTKTCGELRLANAGETVTLAGWVQRARKMGGMTFVDLRDRYGITQLVFNNEVDAQLCEAANHLGREFVIQVSGKVSERSSKNANMPTGEIEIIVDSMTLLNKSEVPPFTIEDNTDGGDDLRMKYRYLDLRRAAVRKNLELRHRMTMEVRRYLDSKGDAYAHRLDAGGRTRLCRAFTHEPRTVLRFAAVAANAETAANGLWFRPLLPNREMLPRRGPARRPSAGVHADRLRNELRGAGRHHRDV